MDRSSLRLIDFQTEPVLKLAPRTVVTLLAKSVPRDNNCLLEVGEGAGVHFIIPFITQNMCITVQVKDNAQFTLSVLSKIRSQVDGLIKVLLVGRGARAYMQLALINQAESEVNLTCSLEHLASGTLGRLTARRIVMGNAKSFLRGLLKIDKGAAGTDTYLSDKVVILDKQGQAGSDPQLEIQAADVKASHGAAIGHLNEEELFYLQSRGLPRDEAVKLLLESLLQSVLVGVPLEISTQFLNDIPSFRPST